ncbi:hypothetical protein ACISRB_28250, partial [Micromonospora aurantiaca]
AVDGRTEPDAIEPDRSEPPVVEPFVERLDGPSFDAFAVRTPAPRGVPEAETTGTDNGVPATA